MKLGDKSRLQEWSNTVLPVLPPCIPLPHATMSFLRRCGSAPSFGDLKLVLPNHVWPGPTEADGGRFRIEQE